MGNCGKMRGKLLASSAPCASVGRQAYTLGLQLVMAKNLNVSVDAAALADTEHAEVAARAHAHEGGMTSMWPVAGPTLGSSTRNRSKRRPRKQTPRECASPARPNARRRRMSSE